MDLIKIPNPDPDRLPPCPGLLDILGAEGSPLRILRNAGLHLKHRKSVTKSLLIFRSVVCLLCQPEFAGLENKDYKYYWFNAFIMDIKTCNTIMQK